MKKELEQVLFERYPRIFEERNQPMTHTAMCWGIAVGDGWFDLVNALCEQLQLRTLEYGEPQIVAQQVKEKLGQLRFRVGEASETQRTLIEMAQSRSTQICEICARPGTLYLTGHLWGARCEEHSRETGWAR